MLKKLLLIQPTPYDQRKNLIKRSKLYFVGLALPLLAALTPEDWEVEIVLETIENVPWDTEAPVIGISSMGHGVIRSLELAKEFKKRGKTVILGGYMVSLMPEEAKKYCNSVVIGDAEGVWRQVLKDWEEGSLQPFYQQTLTSLEDLPLPRYDLIIAKSIGDFLPVQAGRGCPNCCSFCSIYCLYRGKYLKRSIPEVMRDIQYIKSLGYNKFLLLDDNIAADKSYMLDLVREIGKLKMHWYSQCDITVAKHDRLLKALAAGGCLSLSFGLESITQASLNELHKDWAKAADYPGLIRQIRQAGIEISTEMVVGTDADTVSSIMSTAKFIEEQKIAVPRFYILTPIPGTDLYKRLDCENRLVNLDIYSYNGTEAVHRPQNMTPEELTAAYWNLYRKVYSLSSIFRRVVWNRNLLTKPLTQLFYLAVNFIYRNDLKKGIPPNII